MDNFSKTCAAIILLLSLAAGAVALDARAEDYTPEETAQEEQEQAPSIDTSGYVQVAGWSTGGYGNYVIIYHGKMSDGNTYSTLYAHMRSVATSAGKYVKQGELIGYVGTTGNSTGNHLHLEVWKGGSKANAVNPRSCIPIPHN